MAGQNAEAVVVAQVVANGRRGIVDDDSQALDALVEPRADQEAQELEPFNRAQRILTGRRTDDVLESPDDVAEEQRQGAASPEAAYEGRALKVATGRLGEGVVGMVEAWDQGRIIVLALLEVGGRVEKVEDVGDDFIGELGYGHCGRGHCCEKWRDASMERNCWSCQMLTVDDDARGVVVEEEEQQQQQQEEVDAT
jgi:hypothetical protein